MPGRIYTSNTYRYGFNGKEKDDDVKGSSAQYDYGFRIYDPRLGKFLSEDPLTESYPWYSPYHFAGNTPIMAIDVDGLEPQVVIDKANEYIGTLYEWGGKSPTANWKGIGIKLRTISDGDVNSFLSKISLKFKDSNPSDKPKIYDEINEGIFLDGYKVKYGNGTFGIDCSGLATASFNADQEKIMNNFNPGIASAQMQYNIFSQATLEGKGILHRDFNSIGKGDLVFHKNGKKVHHVMVATGNVSLDKNGNVNKFEVIHAPESGKQVRTEWMTPKKGHSIGHTYRNGDILTPINLDDLQSFEDLKAIEQKMEQNIEKFKNENQHVVTPE